MKNLKNLGKVLSKVHQRAIKGGVPACGLGKDCPAGWCCPVDPDYPSNRACAPFDC